MKKVCIVIVNYNGYSLLNDTILSVSGLDYTNYDIVVVDNNSNEPFPNELLKRYPQVVLLKQTDNWGFAKGNNIGITYSIKEHYEYTLLLNNDVHVDSKLLSEMIDIADDNTIVVPKIYYYDKPDVLWYAGGEILYGRMESKNIGYGEKDTGQYNKIKNIEFMNGCCTLIKNTIFEKIGLLDEDYFLYFEDFDFGIRAINNGISIQYQPKARLWHKVSSSSGGENSKVQVYYMTRNRLIFSKKHPKVFGFKAKLFCLLKCMIKILLAFFGYKRNNLYIIKGYIDYKNNVLGKVDFERS